MQSIKKMLVIMSFILVFFSFYDGASVKAASINKTKVTLLNGQSVSLKVNGKKEKIKWYSSKKSVATVNSKGLVKAKKKGVAKITAKIGKKKYTCKVTVQSPKLSKTKLSLKYGKSYKLKLSGTNQKVQWSSSDINVATVSSKGKITAKGNGIAIITARVLGKKFSCKVTVSGKKVSADFSESEARRNISVTSQKIGDDLVVFFNSNYDWLTYIECSCYYYDKNRNPIYVDGKINCIAEKGREAVIIFDCDRIDYSTYEIRYEFSRWTAKPNEPSFAKYINVSGRIVEDKLILTFNNTYNKFVDGADVIIKYYDSSNRLVAVGECGSDRIPANGYSISSTDLPRIWDEKSDEYKDTVFSRYEIYVSHVTVWND